MKETDGRGVCRNLKQRIFGPGLLVGAGVVLLLNNFVPEFSVGQWWPLLLVIMGAGLLADRLCERGPRPY